MQSIHPFDLEYSIESDLDEELDVGPKRRASAVSPSPTVRKLEIIDVDEEGEGGRRRKRYKQSPLSFAPPKPWYDIVYTINRGADALPQEDPHKVALFSTLLSRLGFKVPLFPHQRIGVQWWVRKEGKTQEDRQRLSGGIIGDDMGLGKTTMALAVCVISRHMESKWNPNPKPTLIVCPKAVLEQWLEEIRNKTTTPDHAVHRFYEEGRSISQIALEKKVFVVTTYDVVRNTYKTLVGEDGEVVVPIGKRGPIFDILWERIILDECHVIKNAKGAKRHRAVCLLRSNRRWEMSGTPINNSVDDLAALNKFIGIMPYAEADWWKRASAEQISQWRKDSLIMRSKAILNLPPISHQMVSVALDARENEFYDRLALEAEANFSNFLHSSGVQKSKMMREMLVWLLRLRQSTCDPSLVLGRRATVVFSKLSKASRDKYLLFCHVCDRQVGRKKVKSDHYRLKCQHVACTKCGKDIPCTVCRMDPVKDAATRETRLFRSTVIVPQCGYSTKTRAIVETAKRILEQDETNKIAIFSQWTSYLDLLEHALSSQLRVDMCRLDGDVDSVEVRNEIVKSFFRYKSKRIFLISLNAGGVGLNLACANHAFLCDRWYNPFVEKQAVDRLHRLGQTRPVSVHHFVTETSVDVAMANVQEKKMCDAKCYLEGTTIKSGTGLDEEEMKSFFGDLINARRARLMEKEKQKTKQEEGEGEKRDQHDP